MKSLDTVILQMYRSQGSTDIYAVLAGAVDGYMAAHGFKTNTFYNRFLEVSPLVIQSAMGAKSGLDIGIAHHENNGYIAKGAALGLGLGALEVGIGYCLGYAFGGLTK
jgi:hypothetical protein